MDASPRTDSIDLWHWICVDFSMITLSQRWYNIESKRALWDARWCMEYRPMKPLEFMCTVKNISRFNSKITDNQLPVHFSLFFTGARIFSRIRHSTAAKDVILRLTSFCENAADIMLQLIHFGIVLTYSTMPRFPLSWLEKNWPVGGGGWHQKFLH